MKNALLYLTLSPSSRVQTHVRLKRKFLSFRRFLMTKLSKYIGLGVLASGLFFGTILTAYADDPATNDNNGPAQVGGDHGWNKKDWGDGWKDKFGLTDDQSKQLKDLFKKQREETKTLADQMKIDMDTLKLKVDSKASDGQIKALLDKISSEKKSYRPSASTLWSGPILF